MMPTAQHLSWQRLETTGLRTMTSLLRTARCGLLLSTALKLVKVEDRQLRQICLGCLCPTDATGSVTRRFFFQFLDHDDFYNGEVDDNFNDAGRVFAVRGQGGGEGGTRLTFRLASVSMRISMNMMMLLIMMRSRKGYRERMQ